MVNHKLYYILDELKGIVGSTGCMTPQLLYEWLRAKNYLNGNEIYLIEKAGIPLSQINVLCDFLKAKSDEIFAEVYKAAEMNKWVDITGFLKRELEKHNLAYLLNLSNGSEQRPFSSGINKPVSLSTGREIRKVIDEHWKLSKYNEKRPFLFDVKPISFFTGREVIIKEIHKTIQTWEQSNGTNRLVISGLGGIGKTELVLAYIHKHRQTFKSIVWINAKSNETLKTSFCKLAFGSETISESIAFEVLVTQVFEALSSTFGKENLVVFDNADEIAHQKLLPTSSDSHFFIIISQHQSWSSSEFKIIKLQEFTLEEAIQFVEESCKQDAKSVGVDMNDIKDFVLALGCFPLALKQAVSYIKKMAKYKTYSFKDFLSEFKGNTDGAKKLLSFLLQYTYDKLTTANTFIVWKDTFDKIHNDIIDNEEFVQNCEHTNFSKRAQLLSSKILNICAYLNNENIPIDIFSDALIQDVDQLTMSAIERLEEYCLLIVTEGEHMMKTNKLIQLVTRLNLLEANQTEQYINTAMDLLVKKFLYNDQSSSAVHKKRTLLSHFIELKRHIIYFEKQLNKDIFLNLVSSVLRCINVTYFVIHESIPRQDAKELAKELLSLQEIHYGPEHPIIAITLIDLTNASDDFETKQILLERALQIQERYYGLDNFQLVITNLANVYDSLKNHEAQNILPEKQHNPVSQQHTGKTQLLETELKASTVKKILKVITRSRTKTAVKHKESEISYSKLNNNENAIKTGVPTGLNNDNLNWYKYLVYRLAEINIAEKDYKMHMYLTVTKDNLDMVKDLVAKGANINITDNWNGNRWLHLAAERGNIEVVRYLIGKGGDVNVADNDGWRPLQSAAKGGHLDVVEYLVEKGADVNVADRYHQRLLHLAAKGGQLDVAKYLVEKGADINVADRYRQRPLHLAAKGGHLNVVKHLVEKGADINVADRYRQRPLHLAAKGGHLNVVKHLVEKGAHRNAADNEGQRPLHLAVEGRYFNVLKYLVEKGADINVADKYGQRPLHLAAKGGHLDVVKHLVEKGADVNVADMNGQRLLHSAAKGGHLDVAKYLVENGAEINVADIYGQRLLHLAAKGGHLDVVKYLVEKGADVNVADNDGWRPLYLAVEGRHFHVAKYLVEKGADINLGNLKDDWDLFERLNGNNCGT